MKRSLKILFLVICLFSFCNVVNAVSEKNLVNIYLFHSYTCKHCKEEIKLLDELEKEYDNIKVYKYEVNENENGELLKKSIILNMVMKIRLGNIFLRYLYLVMK